MLPCEEDKYLLSVPRMCYRFVVIAFDDNVSQLGVGNIFHYVPLHWEEPIPLVALPKVHVLGKIHLSNHFS